MIQGKESLVKGKCTFERKSIPIVAWYMLSKESYMKRVIKEVLPTAKNEVQQESLAPEF